MKVLSAFSSVGIGETRWSEIPDIEITAVELVPELAEEYSKRFPANQVIVGDAYEFIYQNLDFYDIIFATPPCQSYSRMSKGKQGPDIRIVELAEYLLDNYDGSWVIENVDSQWLRDNMPISPVKIDRHLFWSNIKIQAHVFEPKTRFNFIRADYKRNGLSQVETHIQDLENWLGVKLSKRFYIRGNHNPSQIYCEGLHPDVSLDVLKQLIEPRKTVVDFLKFSAQN